jgi:hypothetical protein
MNFDPCSAFQAVGRGPSDIGLTSVETMIRKRKLGGAFDRLCSSGEVTRSSCIKACFARGGCGRESGSVHVRENHENPNDRNDQEHAEDKGLDEGLTPFV